MTNTQQDTGRWVFRVHYSGPGRGWHVLQRIPGEPPRVVSGPWTSKAQAQADADARAAS